MAEDIVTSTCSYDYAEENDEDTMKAYFCNCHMLF